MADQEQHVDERVIYDVVLKLQDDVRIKFDELGKQVGELTTYVIQAKALEEDRKLPGKIQAQADRITALEHALTTAKAFGWFASIVSTLLAIWQVIKALTGH